MLFLDVNKTFARNLKNLMDSQNMTYTQLANHIGVSRSTVSMWMSYKSFPRTEMLDRIANYFNVPVESLLAETKNDTQFHVLDIIKELEEVGAINKETLRNSLSKEESELLSSFNVLNSSGKQEAIKRVEELTEIKKYTE